MSIQTARHGMSKQNESRELWTLNEEQDQKTPTAAWRKEQTPGISRLLGRGLLGRGRASDLSHAPVQ